MWSEVSAVRSIVGAVATATLAACYAPSPPVGAPCNPLAPQCPSEQACLPFGGGGAFVCSTGGFVPDFDGGPDTPERLCFGTGLIRNLCLSEPPVGVRDFAGSVTLNTATVGEAACTEIVAQPVGPSLCVVAGQAIRIDAGAVVRAVGANPLVLVGEFIDIGGEIDAAGHGGQNASAGAGAQAVCAGSTAGTDAVVEDGGGGGAGGSFGGAGSNGGPGNAGAPGGVTGPAVFSTVAIGGCPGTRGGNGTGGGGSGAGAGGPAGGAVYAIASQVIQVDGTINASGGGGGGGTNGTLSGGGGGGGGSGGLIAFDAPVVSTTGAVYANGGGGGGGNGSAVNARGGDGSDATAPIASAPGGAGGNGGGGNGGRGFAQGSLSASGRVGTGSACGGGGGGGGAGAILVFAGVSNLGGSMSPAPR